ncbi:ECF RNA polymerase sigma factor SigH [compost metagenome]
MDKIDRHRHCVGEGNIMPERLDWLLDADFHNLAESVQEEVYYAFYDLVYGAICYVVKDHQTTEDIIQEAFLKVVEKKPRFEHESAMRAWLKTVARNTMINFLRKNKKYSNQLNTDSVYMNIDPTQYGSTSVEQIVEIKLMEEAIMNHLYTLKPEYKTMVEYRWKLGMSYKEIAEELDLCENIVRQRLFRTREGIKKMLFKEWGGDYLNKPAQSRISR